jgi:SpoVG.
MAEQYQVIEPNCGIKVTQVRVFPFKETSHLMYTKGMAVITLNDAIVIRNLRIMDGRWYVRAYRLDRSSKGDDARSIVAPSRDDVRSYIEAVVLNKFNEVK